MTVSSVVGPAYVLSGSELPRSLLDLERPPDRLFVAGSLPPLDRAVSIVGTRRASADGIAIAQSLASRLGAAGCVIVSGAAHGIDGAAHRGALGGGQKTLAVLAAPLSAPYPASHLGMLRTIAAGAGAVITEAETGARPFASSFLDRNRLVAALGHATVVVESPVRSGTLSTVAHARALGRLVLAVPWSPLDAARAGGVALLVRGHARAVRDANDVLDALGWSRPETVATPPLGEHARRVLDALRAGATYADAIGGATGLTAPEVSAALVELVVEDAATEDHGRYRPR